MDASGPSPDLLLHVRNHCSDLLERSPVYSHFLKDIQIESATKGTVVASLKVLPIHTNSKGTLHGTVSACLVDWAGGMAIASEGVDRTGVSTDIHVTYLAAAREGDSLEIESDVSKLGSTLAFTTVRIRKIAGDGLKIPVANGSHTKYVAVK